MDINERVMENLKRFDLDTNIKPTIMRHLVKIEEVLAVMTQAQTNAIQEIRNNKISINKVAKESGISRQTFYNNPILTAYIEAFINMNTSPNPYELIDSLREEIRRKDNQIAAMVQRDATVSKCKAEIAELTEEIVSLRATISSQESLLIDLRKKSADHQSSKQKLAATSSVSEKIRIVPTPNDLSEAGKYRIVSWNVRGLKSAITKGGLQALITKHDPDIICLQEILVTDEKKIEALLSDYNYCKVINTSKDPNFKSGTIIMAKGQIINCYCSFKGDCLAKEGRIITCELQDFYIVNVYVPALSNPNRLNIKLLWWEQVMRYIKDLESKKPVLLCGDMNATVNELDVGVIPNTAGCTAEEQAMLAQLLSDGYVDVFRFFYPDAIGYTWHYNNRSQSGMRLDYFFAPEKMIGAIEENNILTDVRTSDHLPVLLVLNSDALR